MSEEKIAPNEQRVCGVVRPISAIGNYSSSHWSEVAQILDDSIQMAGFEPRLVSEANSTGIIHARIVANLYKDPIVLCDISGKNPNVMLELGMRLAFDKPVVVVKDDITDYSFDTSPIEHISYPSSLHYPSIVEFKDQLSEKIKSTLENYDSSKSFLQQFGPIKVADIKEIEVPGYEIVREEIREIRDLIQSSQARFPDRREDNDFPFTDLVPNILVFRKKLPDDKLPEVIEKASRLNGVDRISIYFEENKMKVRVKADRLSGWTQKDANEAVRGLLRKYLVSVPMP
ncbi:hypothetical protein [Sphingopyxis fribergensis]